MGTARVRGGAWCGTRCASDAVTHHQLVGGCVARHSDRVWPPARRVGTSATPTATVSATRAHCGTRRTTNTVTGRNAPDAIRQVVFIVRLPDPQLKAPGQVPLHLQRQLVSLKHLLPGQHAVVRLHVFILDARRPQHVHRRHGGRGARVWTTGCATLDFAAAAPVARTRVNAHAHVHVCVCSARVRSRLGDRWVLGLTHRACEID